MSRYKTALITGASRGIGEGLARALAAQKTRVFLCARSEDALQRIAGELQRNGALVDVVVMDVNDTEATVARIRAIDQQVNGLDLIIANAGVGAGTQGSHVDAWENLRDAFHTNFCGATATLTAVLPAMVARGRGHLVAISSLASFGALPQSAAYCAPKAGLSMLLDCLRIDLRGTGVDVTTVHVGFVRTEMVAHATHPMPQLIEVDEAVRTIVQALPEGPDVIEFPKALALAARAAGALPRGARSLLTRAMTRVR